MSATTNLYWIHALTPLHVGIGQGVGFIDLPIMREKVTNWPIIPGSSIKGVLSDYHNASREENREKDPHLKAAFGTAGDENSNAGSLVFTDARIVCFPVRSLYGTFAWVTSPMALSRLERELERAKMPGRIGSIPAPGDTQALIPNGAQSALKSTDNKIYFEDLDLAAEESPEAKLWCDMLAKCVFPDPEDAWRAKFAARFAVVSDEVFDFLCDTATEVNTRVRIDPDRKIVASGALWMEEALPAETILAGAVWCDKVYVRDVATEALVKRFASDPVNDLQIGGKTTIGKGQARCLFTTNVEDK